MLQFLKLLFIAVANPFYNLALAVLEMSRFCRYGWWWKLRARLFIEYAADSPFAVVKREGPRAPVALQNLIYGETPCLTIKEIIEEFNPRPTDRFVDLGCGRGLTVFFARLYFRIPAAGIEVLPTFVSRARKTARKLGIDKIDFICENLSWATKEQIEDGTIFYLAGSAFDDELLDKISERLELLPKGVRLATLSEALPSDQFKVTAVKPYWFSWGKTEVYFHEKID